jgi:hypothetical protein
MNVLARRLHLTLLFGLLACMPAGVLAQADSDLYGGWIVTEWNAPNGMPVQRGLFLFTESGHYSMMFVVGVERSALSASPTDTEIAAAANPFVANSGRYSVSANEITYEAFVAKDPAYMSRFEPTGGEGNAQTMTYGISDGMLTLEFGEGGPMSGATAILRRPGGGQ